MTGEAETKERSVQTIAVLETKRNIFKEWTSCNSSNNSQRIGQKRNASEQVSIMKVERRYDTTCNLCRHESEYPQMTFPYGP